MMQNIAKPCFYCNESIYINKEVRRPENPNQLQPLDEPFTGACQIKPHVCNALNQERQQVITVEPKNNYQVLRKGNPAEIAKTKPSVDNDDDDKNYFDVKRFEKLEDNVLKIREDVNVIKELVEAMVKSQAMFKPASEYPRVIDQTHKTSPI